MATIDDVAKLAEVSKGTVSNVFSKKRPISKEVSDRVLEAARELNYVPSHIARSLAIRKTMTVGLKMPLPNEMPMSGFEFQLMNGVIRECNKNGYRVLLDSLPEQEDDVTLFSIDPVDGVIMLNPRDRDPRIEKYGQRFPLVLIGRPSPKNDAISYVDNNNLEMAREVGRYLLMNSHRSILFLNAARNMTVADDRQNGLLKAFEEWGVAFDKDYIRYYSGKKYKNASEYGYYSVLNTFKHMKYTAVIADTDRVALGVLRAARELGIEIPRELSVVALSNDNTLAQESVPRLTSVELSADRLGAEAAKMLIAQLNGVTSPQKYIIDARLVIRESCSNLQT